MVRANLVDGLGEPVVVLRSDSAPLELLMLVIVWTLPPLRPLTSSHERELLGRAWPLGSITPSMLANDWRPLQVGPVWEVWEHQLTAGFPVR